jgi:hypothetical protein
MALAWCDGNVCTTTGPRVLLCKRGHRRYMTARRTQPVEWVDLLTCTRAAGIRPVAPSVFAVQRFSPFSRSDWRSHRDRADADEPDGYSDFTCRLARTVRLGPQRRSIDLWPRLHIRAVGVLPSHRRSLPLP